jgi:hypothetical protein
MNHKLLAVSMLAGVLTVAGSAQSSSFSDLASGRLAPSTRARTESPSSSTYMGSGFSSASTLGSGSDRTSDSFGWHPSGRLAPSTRKRSESPSSSTDMGSGFSSGSDGASDSSQSPPSVRPAPSRRTREFSGD